MQNGAARYAAAPLIIMLIIFDALMLITFSPPFDASFRFDDAFRRR